MDEQRNAVISDSADILRASEVSDQGASHALPRSTPTVSDNRPALGLKNILWTAVFAALLFGGLASFGVSRFGSLGALVAALRGRVLYLEPASIAVGSLKPREQVKVLVRLRNLASKPIKVLGSHSPCGCLVAKELPLELAPGEVREVPIYFTAPANGTAEFEIVVSFYANVAGEQPQVVLHGRVLAPDPGSGKPRDAG